MADFSEMYPEVSGNAASGPKAKLNGSTMDSMGMSEPIPVRRRCNNWSTSKKLLLAAGLVAVVLVIIIPTSVSLSRVSSDADGSAAVNGGGGGGGGGTSSLSPTAAPTAALPPPSPSLPPTSPQSTSSSPTSANPASPTAPPLSPTAPPLSPTSASAPTSAPTKVGTSNPTTAVPSVSPTTRSPTAVNETFSPSSSPSSSPTSSPSSPSVSPSAPQTPTPAASAPTSTPLCNTQNCKKCQQQGCEWWNLRTVGGDGGCYSPNNRPSQTLYEKISTCPACEAKDCAECFALPSGCKWFVSSSVNPFEPKCAEEGCDTSLGGSCYQFSPVASAVACPACSATACNECHRLQQDGSNNCTWSTLIGTGARGRCAKKADVSSLYSIDKVCSFSSCLTVSWPVLFALVAVSAARISC